MTLYEELKWRGLIKDISSDELIDKLNHDKLTFYWGTDPTADSLHLGHYSSLVTAKRLAKYGHKFILLVGGATGLIGDPRPTAEREIITVDTINKNLNAISNQVKKLVDENTIFVNNYYWMKDYSFLNFLRDVGKYVNVSYMINKDLVKRQMDIGISYAEFSYMLIQGYDFKYIHDHYGADLQFGGSDQWGNLTTGIELIRKLNNEEVYAFSVPLILDSTGKKLGKSYGNALWLDEEKTTSYEMYQYLLNFEDIMMEEYLKKYTFLNKEEIESIMKEHNETPEKRIAQKRLAYEVITYLHGEDAYKQAVKISESLFSGDIASLTSKEIEQAFKGIEQQEIDKEYLLVDLLVEMGICKSKREAREFITNGSISINGKKITDLEFMVTKEVAIEDKYIIIRRGKKKYFIIVFK